MHYRRMNSFRPGRANKLQLARTNCVIKEPSATPFAISNSISVSTEKPRQQRMAYVPKEMEALGNPPVVDGVQTEQLHATPSPGKNDGRRQPGVCVPAPRQLEIKRSRQKI